MKVSRQVHVTMILDIDEDIDDQYIHSKTEIASILEGCLESRYTVPSWLFIRSVTVA